MNWEVRLQPNGSKSKAKGPNPKDILGAKKVDFTALPAIAMAHGAMAMMDGARKYGPYNWRSKKVVARIYIAAAMRHLLAYLEGEEYADDSDVHHLGHAIACCAIILDARNTGNLIDDRPIVGKSTTDYVEAIKTLSEVIKSKSSPSPKENLIDKLFVDTFNSFRGDTITVKMPPAKTGTKVKYSRKRLKRLAGPVSRVY